MKPCRRESFLSPKFEPILLSKDGSQDEQTIAAFILNKLTKHFLAWALASFLIEAAF